MTKLSQYLAALSVFSLLIPSAGNAETNGDLTARVMQLEERVRKLENRVKAQGFHVREHQKCLVDSSTANNVSSSEEKSVPIGISRQELDRVLDDLPQYMADYRSVPYFREGKMIGLRFFAIRRGGILEKFGLRNGDILLSVDGQNIDSPQNLEKILFGKSKLKDRELMIERAKKKMSMKVPIGDE